MSFPASFSFLKIKSAHQQYQFSAHALIFHLQLDWYFEVLCSEWMWFDSTVYFSS